MGAGSEGCEDVELPVVGGRFMGGRGVWPGHFVQGTYTFRLAQPGLTRASQAPGLGGGFSVRRCFWVKAGEAWQGSGYGWSLDAQQLDGSDPAPAGTSLAIASQLPLAHSDLPLHQLLRVSEKMHLCF